MGPPFMDPHYTACLFPIDAGHVGRKNQSHRESTIIFSMWSALCPSAWKSKPEKINKKGKQMEVHDWLKYRFVCVVFCLFLALISKQKSKLQTALKKLIVFNGTYIHTYIHTFIHTYLHTYI